MMRAMKRIASLLRGGWHRFAAYGWTPCSPARTTATGSRPCLHGIPARRCATFVWTKRAGSFPCPGRRCVATREPGGPTSLPRSTRASFRAWRCFDDFEGMPLHGTFLIDGDGKVRWQDVSFEPFTQLDWLLGESRRLLALPANAGSK